MFFSDSLTIPDEFWRLSLVFGRLRHFVVFCFLLAAAALLTGCVASTQGFSSNSTKTSSSTAANTLADKTIVQSISYANASQVGPPLVVLPGQFKSNNSAFAQKITSNNIADFAEIELQRANFKVLERDLLGTLLDEVTLSVNMGDQEGLKKFRKGKFLSTRWFIQFDILKAEPVAGAGTGFDGEKIGRIIEKVGNGTLGGLVTGKLVSSVKNNDEATVWIVGIRYRILDASTTEIVKTGYIEDKMEVGSSTVTVMGISQSENRGTTMDSMVQRLVQKCIVEIDKCKGVTPSVAVATESETAKNIQDKQEKTEQKKIAAQKDKRKAIIAANSVPSTPSEKVFTDPITGMEFVLVPGGCFQMGDTLGDGNTAEKPVHKVCVDGFYLGKYEVTQIEFQKIMDVNPSNFKKGDRYPVESVSWDATQNFINALNSKSGKSYRLPTEAEWEYAAKAGGGQDKYAGSNDIDVVAWHSGNSGDELHPVGQKQPNSLGLYDLSGNVWEWCSDWYNANYYRTSPQNKPDGPSTGTGRVDRGGGWDSNPRKMRTANRDSYGPDRSFKNIGFRIVHPVQVQ